MKLGSTHLRWPWLVLLPSVIFTTALGADLDLADLFSKTSPSVVTLTAYTDKGKKLGQGSGFIVDKSGVIVTCLHVVGPASTVEIQSADQSTQSATALICSDREWDVAILKTAPLPQAPLKLAPPEAVRIGTAVIAIGSPLGYGNTLSQGLISGLRPHAGHGDMIQITAPISHGSSGGPILSTSTGEILGMTASSLSGGQNINFAVPARVIAEKLKLLDQSPERVLTELSPAAKMAREEAKKVRDKLDSECSEADATVINQTINDAITSGVGIYNGGDHLGCYRVYEGAAYKILFKLSTSAPTATGVLKSALKKAESDNATSTAKAWIMREAFDSMAGVHSKREEDTPPDPKGGKAP